ncbi:MAG: GAF domain-containing protein, partial [Candidatus Kariarchaeaceae archaeon]
KNEQIVESILNAISQAETFDELAQRIVETCSEEFNAQVCTLWKRYTDENSDRLRLAAASAKAPRTIAQEVDYEIRQDNEGKDADGITGFVAQTGQFVLLKSFKEAKEKYKFCWKGKIDGIQWDGSPEESFKSLIAIPLLLGSKVVGVLKLENKRDSTNGFTDKDCASLFHIAPYIAIAVYSLKLLDPHERRLIEAPALFAETMLSPFETHELVQQIVKKTAEILNAEICTLWLVHPDRKELRIEAYHGFESSKEKFHTYSLNWDAQKDEEIDGITAWVAIRQKSFWANSWPQLQQHRSWKGKWDPIMWQNGVDFRCLYSVPLIREQRTIGVLKVENRVGASSFTETDKVLFNIMASFIVLVLELGQQFRISMISNLAHIIRSPIGQVVMNLLGLKRELNKESPNKERSEKYIELIKIALLAINVTSETLAAFATESLISDKEVALESKFLAELIKDRIKTMKPLVPSEMQINLSKECDDDQISLGIIDQTNFQVLFDNILHNAIKFSPPQGPVEIIIGKDNNDLHLKVLDHGVGISENDLPHVFEPGFKRRAEGQPDSVGMGLATVSKLLEKFGWKYDIESKLNVGTTFDIIIPT